MPTTTSVSGFNSTTNKLIAQVDNKIAYFTVSYPITMATPVLTLTKTTKTDIELNWVDNSLEAEFIVQYKQEALTYGKTLRY